MVKKFQISYEIKKLTYLKGKQLVEYLAIYFLSDLGKNTRKNMYQSSRFIGKHFQPIQIIINFVLTFSIIHLK